MNLDFFEICRWKDQQAGEAHTWSSAGRARLKDFWKSLFTENRWYTVEAAEICKSSVESVQALMRSRTNQNHGEGREKLVGK